MVEPLGRRAVRGPRRRCRPSRRRSSIDPDRVLLDANPANNVWQRTPRVTRHAALHDARRDRPDERLRPVELHRRAVDLGADVPRPVVHALDDGRGCGPGCTGRRSSPAGPTPRSGPTTATLVVGVDGLVDHWPWPRTQVGFNVEQRIAGPWGEPTARTRPQRASVFGRYVFQLRPAACTCRRCSYVEAFATYQDNFLPFARTPAPGAVRPEWTRLNGLHYRLNLYTPYWDPECGVWVDLVAAGGVADLAGERAARRQLRGELAAVRKLPGRARLLLGREGRPAGSWRMGALPDEGQFFALGGGTLFRGFDLAERQGSFLWVANAELRLPLVRGRAVGRARQPGRRCGTCALAAFYDVGAVYANGRSVGGVAHALGAGLRVDVAFFSFIERATVRFDVGKTINAATPLQFWFGVQHPF